MIKRKTGKDMNQQQRFQEQLQNPKWCERQVKHFLTHGTVKYMLFLFFATFITHLCTSAVYSMEPAENSGADLEFLFLLLYFLAYTVVILLFFSIVFLKRTKRWKRMARWGNQQEINRSICMEFFDRSHPPKKAGQVWVTPHYIVLAPKILPKLFYLPLITERNWTPKEGDVLYFADGGKIGLTGLPTNSRVLIEGAIAGYL